MSQGHLLVVDLFHCLPHDPHDHPVLLTLWLSLEEAASPDSLDFSHYDALLLVDYDYVALSTFQLYRECCHTGQQSGCSSFYRVGAVIQILSECQLRHDHHGLVEVVRQCLQTFQCRLMGLVVLDITVPVMWLVKT